MSEKQKSSPSLARRMLNIARDAGAIPKRGKHAQQGWNYHLEADIYQGLRSLMIKHGVYYYVSSEEQTLAENGITLVKIKITFVNADDTDDREIVYWNGQGQSQSKAGGRMDLGSSKANTIAVKYALSKAFMISEFDDPEITALFYQEDEAEDVGRPRDVAAKKAKKSATTMKVPSKKADSKSSDSGFSRRILTPDQLSRAMFAESEKSKKPGDRELVSEVASKMAAFMSQEQGQGIIMGFFNKARLSEVSESGVEALNRWLTFDEDGMLNPESDEEFNRFCTEFSL